MARHARCYLGRRYYPQRERRAYGRRPTSCELLEELPAWVAVRTPADALASVERVAVAMPRGGVRWLLVCPRCRSHVTRLYARHDAPDWPGWCRHCWHLGYASQYTGRRPEAARARVDELARVARRTRDPGVRRRRLARVRALDALRLRRMLAWDDRREIVETLAALPLLLRVQRMEAKHWQGYLRAALREPRDRRAERAQSLAADAEREMREADYPGAGQWAAWAAEALAATLDAERVDDRERDAAERDAAARAPAVDNVITLEALDAAREMYRAGTAPRQQRRAA